MCESGLRNGDTDDAHFADAGSTAAEQGADSEPADSISFNMDNADTSWRAQPDKSAKYNLVGDCHRALVSAIVIRQPDPPKIQLFAMRSGRWSSSLSKTTRPLQQN